MDDVDTHIQQFSSRDNNVDSSIDISVLFQRKYKSVDSSIY